GLQRLRQRHVGRGDGGAARPTVGLDDVAVQGEGSCPELRQVDGCPQCPTDEPLDLLRPAALLALGRLARGPGVGASREHAVLGGHPAAALPQQMGRDALLDGAGDAYPGVADAELGRALRVARHPGGDGERTVIERASVEGAHEEAPPYQGGAVEATGRRSRAAVCARKATTPSAMAWAMRSRYSGRASFRLSSGWEMKPNSTSTAGASTPVST